MSYKKVITATALVGATFSPMGAQALQITDFSTLTKKQIEQSYYFDWNRNSTFRASIYKAFKNSGVNMPVWLRKGGGGSAPARVIQSGSTNFVLLNTCAPVECSSNMMYVVFDPATKTTAAVTKFDKKVSWVGKPNNTVKQILTSASGIR